MNQVLVISGWGYSMTLNSFFQVVRETAKTAIVREIKSEVTRTDAYLAGYEKPVPGAFKSDEKEFRVLKNDDGSYRGKCGLSFTRLLEVWDGTRDYSFNHCD